MNVPGQRALGIGKLVPRPGCKSPFRGRRWASAAFSFGMAATGLVLASTGSAAAHTLGRRPPAPAGSDRLRPDDGRRSLFAHDGFRHDGDGPVTITSPDPAVFAVDRARHLYGDATSRSTRLATFQRGTGPYARLRARLHAGPTSRRRRTGDRRSRRACGRAGGGDRTGLDAPLMAWGST